MSKPQQKYLFVGGPWDGQIHSIDQVDGEWQVYKVALPVRLRATDLLKPATFFPEPIETCEYRLKKFHAGLVVTEVMAASGVTTEEIFVTILALAGLGFREVGERDV